MNSRVCRFLCVAAGVVIVAMAFVPFFLGIFAEEGLWLGQTVLIVFGCAFAVMGLFSCHRKLSVALARASLVVLSMTLALATCEVIFRVAGYDFSRLDKPGD